VPLQHAADPQNERAESKCREPFAIDVHAIGAGRRLVTREKTDVHIFRFAARPSRANRLSIFDGQPVFYLNRLQMMSFDRPTPAVLGRYTGQIELAVPFGTQSF